MKISFTNNEITGDVMGNAIIGDNNNITQNNKSISKDNTFIECLDNIIKYSNDKKEQECAKKAKELYMEDKKSLRNFIIDNIVTFTTGTFATVSGGLLLSVIKGILKIT